MSIYIDYIYFYFGSSSYYYLQKKESGISDISKDELWVRAHIKKNGDPPYSVAADCIVRDFLPYQF